MFAPSPKHQSLSLCQKLVAGQESLARLGQQVRDSGSPHASRQLSQSILTRTESTCSCPQFHTSSLSLTLLHPMPSYLEGRTFTGFSWSPWEEHMGGNLFQKYTRKSFPIRRELKQCHPRESAIKVWAEGFEGQVQTKHEAPGIPALQEEQWQPREGQQQVPQHGENWGQLGSEQRLNRTQATALEEAFCLSHCFPRLSAHMHHSA